MATASILRQRRQNRPHRHLAARFAAHSFVFLPVHGPAGAGPVVVALLLLALLALALWRLRRLGRALRAQGAALEEGRERMERILGAVHEGVIVADDQGRVEFANPSAATLLDVPPDHLVGVRFGERYDGHAPSRLLELLAAGDEADEEIRIPERDRTLRARVGAARHRDGRLLGRIALLTNVSAYVRTERLRREFVANASHELRTPVAAMTAALEALESALDDEAARQEFLERAVEEADNLRRLTDSLLDLSRAEAEAPASAAESCDAGRVARAVAESLRPLARAKRQALEMVVEPELRAVIPAVDLGRILRNLVDNAIQYTPEAGTIRMTGRAAGDGVELAVADTGPGIPAAQLGRIFERFFRLDRSRSHAPGGAGLGLSIARHLAERSGGSLRAENLPEGGARFVLRLKRDPPAA